MFPKTNFNLDDNQNLLNSTWESHFSHFYSTCWNVCHRIFLLASQSNFTCCLWTPSSRWPDGRVISCELHTQVLTLKVMSPELGIEPLSLDTDLTVSQLREVTGGWKPARIATEGHSEVLNNSYIIIMELLHGEVSGCSVLKVPRGFDLGATSDMLKWCYREHLLQ